MRGIGDPLPRSSCVSRRATVRAEVYGQHIARETATAPAGTRLDARVEIVALDGDGPEVLTRFELHTNTAPPIPVANL
jgi:hypothetical protein